MKDAVRRLLGKHRAGSVVGVVAIVALTVAAFWPRKISRPQNQAERPRRKHVIRMWAGDYRPGFRPQGIGPKNKALLEVAAEYMRLHPDVEIQFPVIGQTDVSEGEWLTTQLMSGLAPEIVNVNTEVVWPDIDKGWWVSFDPYMSKPNPYVKPGEPGSRQWWDQFVNLPLTKAKRAPNGKLYSLCFDLVETGIFYNKDIFEKVLGIPKSVNWSPRSWREFMDVCERLRKAGYIPMLMNTWFARDWVQDYLFDQMFYCILDEIDKEKGTPEEEEYLQGYLFPKELCWAIKNRYFARDNPRYRAVWELMLRWRRYWARDIDYHRHDVNRLFFLQKAAMRWDGSWLMRRLRYEKGRLLKFDWGVFYPPPIEKTPETPYACGADPCVIGGAGVQFSVTWTARKEHETDIAMDWLMFMCRPDNAEKIINEVGEFMPNVKGARMPKGLEPFEKIIRKRYTTVKWAYSFDNMFNDSQIRLIELLLGGGISLDEFMAQMDDLLTSTADRYIKMHAPGTPDPWDFSDPKWRRRGDKEAIWPPPGKY